MMSPRTRNAAARFLLLGLTCAILAMGVWGRRGWLDWRRMVRQNGELLSRIEDARTRRDRLEKQIARLEELPLEKERVVREVLGYVRPGEIVIEF